jgi:hypothetical protein
MATMAAFADIIAARFGLVGDEDRDEAGDEAERDRLPGATAAAAFGQKYGRTPICCDLIKSLAADSADDEDAVLFELGVEEVGGVGVSTIIDI